MDAPDPCYIAALRILQYRFNSEAELRRKLRSRKFEKEAIDLAIERLRGERWLDDERFAGAFVRTRASKKVGRNRILRELQAAGVSGEAAAEAVSANLEPEAEQESLRALARRRAATLSRRLGPGFLDTEEGRKKLAVYLLNQGYDAALVYETIKEIKVADHQPDS